MSGKLFIPFLATRGNEGRTKMEVVVVGKGCQSQMHLERNDPMDQYRLAADKMETSLSEKCPVVPGRQQSDHEAADCEAFLRQRKPMAS